ncbi:hypothetical protein EXIGLDRAFT_829282 [Exidia glandulosa HHB12029]|uniref:Uncharacterized protein n=1 Tax=Exidia glandulosa HHB12029 TaxID=1314781 RepID=A0A165PMN3_EXIGL|nr:hypothetical protein EXIGLDRAFT_829282 [Exidia glandulosa HHB12029]
MAAPLLEVERDAAQVVWNQLWGKETQWTTATVDVPANTDDYPWSDPVDASHHSYTCVDIKMLIDTLSLEILGKSEEPYYLVKRAEYQFLLDALTLGRLSKIPAVIITGHPGIGKSFFLLFLLLYRLENRLPTALQFHDSHYFIFDEYGGTAVSVLSRDKRLTKCWALIDSNDLVKIPCGPLKTAERNILAASPKMDRWKSWRKHAKASYIILGLPTMEEIIAVMNLQGVLPATTVSLVRTWGPSLRVVSQLATQPEDEVIFLREAQDSARVICANPSLLDTNNPNLLTSVGSTMLFVRPCRLIHSEPTAHATLFVPTRFLSDMLHATRASLANADALTLFFCLSKHSLTRTPAGWVHEQAVHTLLATGQTALTIERGAVHQQLQPSSNLLHGTLAAMAGVRTSQSFYCIPAATNFPGVDGVLGDGQSNLYAVQATIAGDHKSPADGLVQLWSTVKACQDFTWHILFITIDHATADGHVATYQGNLSVGTGQASHIVTAWGCHLS